MCFEGLLSSVEPHLWLTGRSTADNPKQYTQFRFFVTTGYSQVIDVTDCRFVVHPKTASPFNGANPLTPKHGTSNEVFYSFYFLYPSLWS